MSDTFLEKSAIIKLKFLPLSQEEKYNLLMQMGKELPLFPDDQKIESNRVIGCQSVLYLHTYQSENQLIFNASGDALISKGLAALLIAVYSYESPETILTSTPTFIQEIGIHHSLSLNRSNGLAQIHLRMKQEALKILTAPHK